LVRIFAEGLAPLQAVGEKLQDGLDGKKRHICEVGQSALTEAKPRPPTEPTEAKPRPPPTEPTGPAGWPAGRPAGRPSVRPSGGERSEPRRPADVTSIYESLSGSWRIRFPRATA